MLSIQQKAKILAKAGQSVPASPVDADASAIAAWTKDVENLYVAYVAARAAKSLRDAEDARQLDMLRRLSAHSAYA